MDDSNPSRDSFRSTVAYGTETWDCTRELRSLREAVSRGRAEEASALRRNAEEFERSALRRQHDESTALQQFLQGLHENFESKLERHRAHCGGRLDALERRLDGEVERLASLRCEVAAEARLAVREGFEKLDQYIDAPNASGGEAFAQAIQRSLAKVSAEMQSAAVEEAREASREVANEIVQAQTTAQEVARTAACEAANEVAREIAREVSREVSKEFMEEFQSIIGREKAEAVRQDEKLQALSERLEMMEDFSISMPAAEVDLRRRLEDIEEQSLEDQLSKLTEQVNTGMADLSTQLGDAFAKKFDSLGHEVSAVQKIAAIAEQLAEQSAQSAEEMQQDLTDVRCEIQKVESEMTGAMHGEAEELHLQLREDVAQLLEESEHASSQEIFRQIGKQMEELHADMDEVHEAHDDLLLEFRASTNRSEAAATDFDSTLRKDLQTMLHKHGEEHATRLESVESNAETNHNVAMESLRQLECSEGEALRRFTELAEKMQGAGRSEVTNMGKQLREMRQELTIAASQWRTSASDTAQTLGALTANCQSLNSELKEVQSQGLSHEWRIPKCLQRLEYLSMSEDSGVWLDSPSFSLGPLSQLELRLYPRGFRGGDGQCAVGLYAAGVEGLRAVPFQLDLAVQGLRRRAVVLHEDSAGMLWLVQELGKIEGHLVKTDDLTISVEMLAHTWAAIDGCPIRPSPTPARASRSHVTPEEDHREITSRDDAITNITSRPRPSSTGRISNNPFPKSTNVPTIAAGGGGLFSHVSSVANSPSLVSEVSFGQEESARTARNPYVHPSGSPSGSPLDAPAVPRSSWTVFGEQRDVGAPATAGANPLAAFDSNSSSRSCSTGAVGRRPPASPVAWQRRISASTNPFDK